VTLPKVGPKAQEPSQQLLSSRKAVLPLQGRAGVVKCQGLELVAELRADKPEAWDEKHVPCDISDEEWRCCLRASRERGQRPGPREVFNVIKMAYSRGAVLGE